MTYKPGGGLLKNHLAPCPYHKERGDCGKENRCPLYMYSEYVVCTTLSPEQIRSVRSWVDGAMKTATDIFIASDEEQEDDIMEYCAECRNVDIEKNGVVCLGSEEYRRRKNCLDIKIKWRKP